MSPTHVVRRLPSLAVALLALAAAFVVAGGSDAEANHQPANKVAASGSTVVAEGPGTEVTLLSEELKVSNPTDLLISVSLECSLLTNLTTVGDDLSSAKGRADVWIEIDGQRVPVSEDDEGGADGDEGLTPGSGDPNDGEDGVGEVTFCYRWFQRETSGFGEDDQEHRIATFMRTKSSHAFNWIALNPSVVYDELNDNILTIEVKAQLDEAVDGNAASQAEVVVGNRTLIIEPVMAANDEQVTTLAG